jgi:hypothetical protein
VHITQSTFSHIGELDGAFGAGVHEPITTLGMELGGGDDFGQFLHIGGFDVDNVKALVLDVEVPQIYPQIITRDEGLAITVDGDAVYMVGMCVGVGSARDGGNYSVVMGHTRQLELRSILEFGRARDTPSAGAGWGDFMRQVVLSDDLE